MTTLEVAMQRDPTGSHDRGSHGCGGGRNVSMRPNVSCWGWSRRGADVPFRLTSSHLETSDRLAGCWIKGRVQEFASAQLIDLADDTDGTPWVIMGIYS